VADIRYVDVDYAIDGYWQLGNTAYYIEPDYFADGYVVQGVTYSGEAAIETVSTVVATTDTRIRNVSADIVSRTSTTTSTVKVFGFQAALVSESLISATLLRIEADSLTAFSQIVITASADKISNAQSTQTSRSTLSISALRIKPASVNLLAFDSVTTAAGRIRPAADITALSTTLSATPIKIFGASTNTIDYYNSHQFPIAGVKLYENAYFDGTGYLLYRDSTSYNQSQSFSDSTVIAFYAKADAQAEGAIFSFEGDGVNRPPYVFTFNPGNTENSLRVGTPYGRTWTNLPAITQLHHYAIHFGGANGVTLYVDGIIQNSYSGTISAPNVGWYENYSIIYIGRLRTIQNFGYPGGPNDYRVVQSTWYSGTLAQLWIGRPAGSGLAAPQFVRITDYTPYTFESFGPYGNLSDSQVVTVGNNPPSGAGTDTTLSQPNFYSEFSSSTPVGDLITGNALNISYPLQGNFALIATGYNIQWGQVSLTSRASIRAVIGFLQSSNFSCVSRASLSAAPTNFTKASLAIRALASLSATNFEFTKVSATLTSRFSLTADTDEISSGVSLVVAAARLTVTPKRTRSADATVVSRARLIADGTTNQIVSAVLNSKFTCSATPYNFTKASVAVNSRAAISAESRIFSPPRGTVNISSRFTVTAIPLKLRIQTVAMTARASVLLGNGNALRSGNVTMRAFDTVLTVGQLIEFLIENSITVANEQRTILAALESTVLLVDKLNGVNTVTAETRDITVDSATGVLLAQYNTPHY
jgi:hypothetical protein